ncbi:Pentatricopeptide repeat-containing protein [Acorus gramineus]|uniref:Pentatricopeptide repeat-containing protein n=1 Tax=Acorus gramineus TaxID=55184 RepID=A0AAV9ADE3_ACOGR|nr:Pentatricopeptide repeat-containing protein [Acorus gramineus]
MPHHTSTQPNNPISPSNPRPRPCLVRAVADLCARGDLASAVEALPLLSSRGLRLDFPTLSSLLLLCVRSRSLPHARLLHLHLKLSGLRRHPQATFLSNHILNMCFERDRLGPAKKVFAAIPVKNVFSYNAMLGGYSKMGLLDDARGLFERMPERDLVSWNTMIVAFARGGLCSEAIQFYLRLRRALIRLSPFSFSGVLVACLRIGDLDLLRQVHGQVLVMGFMSNLILSSSIVDAYSKCGEVFHARRLFDEMELKDVLAWTTLVSGYARSGDLESAREVFDRMPEKNSVSWTTLISGYARSGLAIEAIELFREMVRGGFEPDQFTFSSCLCACATVASINHGKQVHARLIRTDFKPNFVVLGSLIDMYSKCGSLEMAKRVFDLILMDGDKDDTMLWNTMISALSQHGRGMDAMRMFREMVKGGTKPDGVTFSIILTACSYSGLMDEGIHLFESMEHGYHVIPEEEHYVCLVELLGRAGRFNEVKDWLENMPFKCSSSVKKAEGEIADRETNGLNSLDNKTSMGYVFLSNIYLAIGERDVAEKNWRLMNKRQWRNERSISWILVDDKLHSFTSSDHLHPSKEEMYSILELLANQIEDDTSVS